MNQPMMQPNLAARQRRSVLDDATAGLGMARGPHISIRGNRFTLVNGVGAEFLAPNLYLDVIVVDANRNTSKVFFEGDYDPSGGNDVPPTCFSDNGTGPSTVSMSPQAPTCAICRWNVVGSDQSRLTGKAIKACSDRKKVGVIIPDDPAFNIYELQIPPGSLTNLRAYSQWLGQQASGVENRKMDIADVVTRLEFEPDKMGILKFTAVAYADDDRTLQVIQYIDENKLSDITVGRNDVAHDPAFVKQMIEHRGTGQALPPPATAPAAAPQGYTLPPRTTAPAALPSGVPAAPPASGRRKRGQAQATLPPAAPAATAPFMAPAANPPAPAPTAAPPAATMRPAGDAGIPDFLRRAPDNAPPAAPAAPVRFGVGSAPPPPAAISDALNQVMSLPTRR